MAAVKELPGQGVTLLPNGNIVIAEPDYGSEGAAGIGRVTLCDTSGNVISSVTGHRPGDKIGSGGIEVLANGHFVINSPAFGSTGNGSKGAVTWGSGTSGISGEVSAENSVITGTNSTQTRVTPLSTGRYVITVPTWNSADISAVGAVTLCDGSQTVSRVVSAENSLIGSQPQDSVGGGVVEVAAGNYVVTSRRWQNGSVANAGAVTWCDGTLGLVGIVSPANSLVGSSTNDQVGAVVVLKNGHYVVVSSLWDRGTIADVGAVTWGDGFHGVSGVVGPTNSLVGDHAGDSVGTTAGSTSITGLADGGYVIVSPEWDNGSLVDAGAVTWCPASGDVVGSIGDATTLKGGNANDQVGSRGLQEVGEGNYVVKSPKWNGGRGAVTWIHGQVGLIGVVSSQNSLVGGRSGDSVGFGGVGRLKNGHYLVLSPFWDNGNAEDAGAVTWGNAVTGITGIVSAANSLVGSSTRDYVGATSIPNIVSYIGTGVVITTPSKPLVPVLYLANGHYVVVCPHWRNGQMGSAGAVVWGDGSQGVKGIISKTNALIGTTAGQRMGQAKALSNGNYVVYSPGWRNARDRVAGAFTWCDGSAGRRGEVSPANSLIGHEAAWASKGEIVALTNGHYVVVNSAWGHLEGSMKEAVTWCDGFQGRIGVISTENSLVGEKVGSGGIVPLPEGDYLVLSPDWTFPATQGGSPAQIKAGAVTWCNGSKETVAEVTSGNSVHGYQSNQTFGSSIRFWEDGSFAVIFGESTSPVRQVAWLTGTGVQHGDARQFCPVQAPFLKDFYIQDHTAHGAWIMQQSSLKLVTLVTKAPVLNANSQGLAMDADTLVLRGHGFSLVPGENQVFFNQGVTGQVISATATELTVAGLSGLQPGPLTATLSGGTAAPVQVAVVYDPVPGSVSFASELKRVRGHFSEALLTVVREGGGNACSVSLQTLNGVAQSNPPFSPAKAGVDYQPPTPVLLNFAAGELVKTVRIPLLPQKSPDGPQKHFQVRLIEPSAGLVLGAISDTVIQILTEDVQPPTVKLLTSLKAASAAFPWRVEGVAGDARGIERVVVTVNDEPPVTAVLDPRSRPAATPFFADLVFDPDPINVITLQAWDLSGNSVTWSREFSFEARQKLTLNRVVPDAFALAPDKAAKITLTATPARDASVLKAMTPGGSPLTSDIMPGTAVLLRAQPLYENAFEQWHGLPVGAVVDGATVRFVMPMVPVNITASFSGNPFLPPSGRGVVFYGLLRALGGTERSHETEGWMTGTLVAKTGAFSGRIMIGGINQPVTAAFSRAGTGLFKSGKVQVGELVFGHRRLSLSYNAANGQDAIVATITGSSGVSQGTMSRTWFDGKLRKVPTGLLNSTAAGFYSLALPAQEQPGLLPSAYPQGTGYATLKLASSGTVTYAGVLADGSAVTAGTALTTPSSCPLYVPLTTPGAASSVKGGSLGGELNFSPGGADNVTAPDLVWFRPAVSELAKPLAAMLSTQLYTDGWPQGITLAGYGALHDVKKSVQSTLGLGPAHFTTGNALLFFDGGKLTQPVEIQSLNILANRVTKITASDKSWTLSFSTAKASFSGTFTPGWPQAAKKLPVFKGILIQQGSMSGGHGFFLSNAEGDPDPESGVVELSTP